MNISYLLSILDLYLKNENLYPLMIDVIKNDSIIKVNFSYSNTPLNKTFVKIDNKVFNENISYFMEKIKQNLDLLNEDYKDNIYTINFNNNRQIKFINFKESELQDIKNKIGYLNTQINFNTIVSDNITYNDVYKENNSKKLSFSMGFSSFITIFLSSIWFLDIIMIALWIFKITK